MRKVINEGKMRLTQYDFQKSDNVQAYNSRQKVVWFLLQHPGTYYSSQEYLAEEISAAGASIKQSAVSKALKQLLNIRKKSGTKEFMIIKNDYEGYRLVLDDEIPNSILKEIKSTGCFAKDYVFYEDIPNPCCFIFWVDPEKAVKDKEKEELKNTIKENHTEGSEAAYKELFRKRGCEKITSAFRNYVGKSNFLDIFIYEDKLIILLSRSASVLIRSRLSNFFKADNKK